ncbi:MAG: S-adenosylmethionine:tRNA ribosyltransferase-isomerase, partial [Deltaproteobacteria bacterium]|nr:S-adenosylmethionine:tRNA ribosyltransferase-isomerase [Deltaproteobacteria bacterium]
RSSGGKIIAVGTTVVRALESMRAVPVQKKGTVLRTSIFIRPPYQFNLIDLMITNFHQPGSSHLMLMEAFMGRRALKLSYEYAVENGYRFLSYGDGMLVL